MGERIDYTPHIVRRAIAALIDYGIYFGLFYTYVKLVGEPTEMGGYEAKGFHHMFLILTAWSIYFPVIESTLGYTLGKGLLDLKVVEEDGSRVLIFSSFQRHLLDIIDFSSGGLVAILCVKFSEKHQRLGDMWAHTHVILISKDSNHKTDKTP